MSVKVCKAKHCYIKISPFDISLFKQVLVWKPLDTPDTLFAEQDYGGNKQGGSCHCSAACSRDAAEVRSAG